jgi:hypothetical protein
MTSISNVLGIAVTTQRPAELISESQLNTYMASFGSQLSTPKAGTATPYETFSQGGTDPGNSGNGKGKKKGHNKSTSEPQ